jgi:hypothetical protein
MSVGFHANFGEIPPGLVIDPNVKTAILVMEHFEVDRVSKIGGDVAEQWGEVMEELLVERLIHRQNKKIVAQLNKSIDKERDDLELSLSEWFDRLSKPSDSSEAQQLQAPQLQAPQLQAPQLQAPQLQAQQLQAQQLQAQQLQVQQLQAQQLQVQQLQAPQLQAPQLQAPQLQAPQLQAPAN